MNQPTFSSIPNLLSIREDVFSENESSFLVPCQYPSNMFHPTSHLQAESDSINVEDLETGSSLRKQR